MLDDGKVIGCALTPRTIAERIQARTNDIPEGEEENEDHPTIREIVDS